MKDKIKEQIEILEKQLEDLYKKKQELEIETLGDLRNKAFKHSRGIHIFVLDQSVSRFGMLLRGPAFNGNFNPNDDEFTDFECFADYTLDIPVGHEGELEEIDTKNFLWKMNKLGEQNLEYISNKIKEHLKP